MHQSLIAADAELVAHARVGDGAAYGELVRRYQDQALATAFVILGDRHEAEDAAQETFTRAYLALDRFRAGASFRAWLLRIAVNEARDLYAARQRRADILARTARPPSAPRPPASAEAEALGRYHREQLLEALFRLRAADRRVLTCRYFLDLSEAEMAGVLGVARGTIKSRLARALGRLEPLVLELEGVHRSARRACPPEFGPAGTHGERDGQRAPRRPLRGARSRHATAAGRRP